MQVQAWNKTPGLSQQVSVTTPPSRCPRLRCQCSRQRYVAPDVSGRRPVYDPEVLPEDEARRRSWPPPPPPPPPRPVLVMPSQLRATSARCEGSAYCMINLARNRVVGARARLRLHTIEQMSC